MPRDGSGAGDSKTSDDPGHNVIHGAGEKGDKASSGVDRSDKAAPMPEHEEGEALDGMNASGGGAGVEGSGKGPDGSEEAKK